ncbi:hypothetical protein FOZ63_027019 [Perkinsus olseni]|uniref:Uncharacterized protein n=1 Tax=Perkinsus olseni TaxID=32597 RepID=A0A7J6UPT3_PEROL|nr:hypothetical protein FOZ63_027019 [Perkinsus olseni]
MMFSRHVLSVSGREMMTRPPMVLARRLSSTPTAPATVSPHILELDTSQHQFAHRFSNIVSSRKSVKATSTQQRLADNAHMLRLVVQRPDGIADATIDKLIRETVKLLNSSPSSSTDILHLAWILCALRRPAELTALSSLALNTLTDPEFVVYFIRYLREANPRFDADHPFSTISRFLAAATGEADTLSDSTVQILVEEFVRSVPDGQDSCGACSALADRLVSKVSSRMDTLDPSTLACLAALTEATGINAPQVVDKAMRVDLTSLPEGTLVAVNKAVFRSGYKGGKLICESALVALPGMTFVAATLYRVQRFYTDMKYYDPLAANSSAELAVKRVKSREFIRNPAEFVSKQRAPAFIKPRMLGLCSAVWAIGTTHELRDKREFATAVEFIFTHPTLNVIPADKEEVFTARQLVQEAQMVSLRGVEQLTSEARSVMHRLLTSTERMNTFRVNEETQRRKHCSKLATLFECCIPGCKASCWVHRSGYHIDVVLNIAKELNSSSSSGKSGRLMSEACTWGKAQASSYRFSREFLLRTSKDVDALAFVTRDEVDALLSNSRAQELTAWVGKALESNMKAMKGAALETAEREPPVPSKQLRGSSRKPPSLPPGLQVQTVTGPCSVNHPSPTRAAKKIFMCVVGFLLRCRFCIITCRFESSSWWIYRKQCN